MSEDLEASRSKENQGIIQTDISSESDQKTTMGRGKRNKGTPGRHLPTETVKGGRSSSDDSYESVGLYGSTQHPAQQAVVTSTAISPGLFF